MPKTCRNHPDVFCYVCGLFTTASQRRNITNDLGKIYGLYFGCTLSDQDTPWAPHVICTSCASGLRDWLNKRKTSMPFAVPMKWREPTHHPDDCYFCLVDTCGFSAKNKHKIVYPNVPSAVRPVVHDETLPVPVSPLNRHVSEELEVEDSVRELEVEDSVRELESSTEPHYVSDVEDGCPQTFSQEELNDLIQDLALSKDKAELLACRLKAKHLLPKNVHTNQIMI